MIEFDLKESKFVAQKEIRRFNVNLETITQILKFQILNRLMHIHQRNFLKKSKKVKDTH